MSTCQHLSTALQCLWHLLSISIAKKLSCKVSPKRSTHLVIKLFIYFATKVNSKEIVITCRLIAVLCITTVFMNTEMSIIAGMNGRMDYCAPTCHDTLLHHKIKGRHTLQVYAQQYSNFNSICFNFAGISCNINKGLVRVYLRMKARIFQCHRRWHAEFILKTTIIHIYMYTEPIAGTMHAKQTHVHKSIHLYIPLTSSVGRGGNGRTDRQRAKSELADGG